MTNSEYHILSNIFDNVFNKIHDEMIGGDSNRLSIELEFNCNSIIDIEYETDTELSFELHRGNKQQLKLFEGDRPIIEIVIDFNPVCVSFARTESGHPRHCRKERIAEDVPSDFMDRLTMLML